MSGERKHTIPPEDPRMEIKRLRDEVDRLKKALTTREETFRAILEAMPDAYFLADAETGRILDANKAAEDLLGRSGDELRTLHQKDLHPPEEENRTSELFAFHASQDARVRTTIVDHWVQHRDGRRIPVQVWALPLEIEGGRVLVGVFRDMSTQSALEAELRTKSEFFQSFVEAIPHPVFSKDEKGRYRIANKAFCDLLGRTCMDIVDHHVHEVAPKDLADEYVRKDKDLFNSEGPIHQRYEEFVFTASGARRRFLFDKAALVGADGERRGIVGSMQDVTENHELEAGLRDSRERFRAIAEYTCNLETWHDPTGSLLWVNPGTEEITGYTVDQCHEMENFPLPLVFEGDRSRVAEMFETAFSERTQGRNREFRGLRKDGKECWLSLSWQSIYDDCGKWLGVRSSLRDVTERKRAEAALRSAYLELETIFNNSMVGILLLRGERRIVRANRRLAKISGYAMDEILGRTTEAAFASRQAYEEFGRRFFPELAGGRVLQLEERFRRKDGTKVWCALWGRALDPPNLENGVLWMVEDITERKRNERLRDNVESIMRHDLKTPLAGVISLPTSMLSDENLTEEQRALLEHIRKAGYSMLDMINRSLDLYKLETGSYALKPEPVDIPVLLERIVFELAVLARSKTLEVRVLLDGHPLAPNQSFTVLGEELLCYSLLANLIKNALEAAPAETEILVDLETGNPAHIRVHNPGAVPRQVRQNFFHKLSSHGKRDGTGLGTYAAKLMAEVQSGTIDMETSMEKGTAVTVTLPVPSIH